MAKTQRSLFETGEATARPDAGLLLVSRPDRPLTAAQREFNKLVIKVEELRERLRKETRRLDNDSHEHAHTGDGRIDDLIVYRRWVSATLHSGRFAATHVHQGRRRRHPGRNGRSGEVNILRRLPPLHHHIEQLWGPLEGARVWESLTPFVPPRHLKAAVRTLSYFPSGFCGGINDRIFCWNSRATSIPNEISSFVGYSSSSYRISTAYEPMARGATGSFPDQADGARPNRAMRPEHASSDIEPASSSRMPS